MAPEIIRPEITRAEIEKTVEPILQDCLRRFGDHSQPGISAQDFAAIIGDELRPDIRRVSLFVSLALSATGENFSGEGLELGCGYGFLLFPLAKFLPRIHWTGIEHPDRTFFDQPAYRQTIHDYNCQLVGLNFVHEPLPFPDNSFSIVTFSETLEHMPVERIPFIFSEMHRVLRPGGLLLVSSPNQVSLENRIRLGKGKSILELPDDVAIAKGTYGHIRLYTVAEITAFLSRYGFSLERAVLESNNSAYRGASANSLRRRLQRLYERIEQRLGFLRGLADTWYTVFRKK